MLTDVESDEFVFIGHMLFNRAKSDFPCPEFNGELSFRVVSTYWFEIYLLETRYFKKRELFMRQ